MLDMFSDHEAPERKDVAEALAVLERLAAAQPDLAQVAQLQGNLIRAIYRQPVRIAPIQLSADDLRASLNGGVPALRNARLPFDPANLRDLLLRLCDAVGGRRAPSGPNALATAVRNRRLDFWELALELLAGKPDRAALLLERHGVQPDSGLTLLRMALLPFLEQIEAQLAPLRQGIAWSHGYCPTCGAWPVLAEQRGLDQTRFLRCGLCACSWEIERVRCPFCGTRDHQQLGYLQVDAEEQRQRVATCDNCQSYIKIRSTLSPLSTPALLAEEVGLLHLDMIALEKGYAPPS